MESSAQLSVQRFRCTHWPESHNYRTFLARWRQRTDQKDSDYLWSGLHICVLYRLYSLRKVLPERKESEPPKEIANYNGRRRNREISPRGSTESFTAVY